MNWKQSLLNKHNVMMLHLRSIVRLCCKKAAKMYDTPENVDYIRIVDYEGCSASCIRRESSSAPCGWLEAMAQVFQLVAELRDHISQEGASTHALLFKSPLCLSFSSNCKGLAHLMSI